MSRSIRLFLGACLVSSVAVVAADVVPVHAALSYPSQFSHFPVCQLTDDEFCIELFEFTPEGGTKKAISDPGNSSTGDPWMSAFISGSYSGASAAPGLGGVYPSLSLNFYGTGSLRAEGNDATTLDGIDDGLYRVVLRTGDYDPSYLLLSGEYSNYTVTRGTDGYFTVDISARPTPYAAVVAMDGDQTQLNTCMTNKWVTNCEANSAYRNYLLVSLVMAPATQRETLRGTWISTNASMFSVGQVNFLTGEFNVNAAGPHYLPDDFGPIDTISDLTGRKLNPARFEMFIPYETVADVVSKVMGTTVTVAQLKLFLAAPTSVVEGTIQQAGALGVLEKLQGLTITKGDAGLQVNFNLTHFSSPNPKLRLLNPTRKRTSLSNGGVINPLRKGKVNTSYSTATLVKPASGTSVTKVTSSNSAMCKVTTSRSTITVKMLKRGTCKLTVTTSRSRRTASTTVSVLVS